MVLGAEGHEKVAPVGCIIESHDNLYTLGLDGSRH